MCTRLYAGTQIGLQSPDQYDLLNAEDLEQEETPMFSEMPNAQKYKRSLGGMSLAAKPASRIKDGFVQLL